LLLEPTGPENTFRRVGFSALGVILINSTGKDITEDGGATNKSYDRNYKNAELRMDCIRNNPGGLVISLSYIKAYAVTLIWTKSPD